MKVHYDFRQNRIMFGNKEINVYDTFLKKRKETYDKYVEISYGIKKHFVMEGFNYWDLVGYFAYLTHHFKFLKHPAMETILNYICILDREINENVELYVKDIHENTFKECVEVVCSKKGHTLRVVEEQYVRPKIDFLYSDAVLRELIKTRIFVRYMLGWFRMIFDRQNKKKTDAVFLASTRFSRNTEEDNQLYGQLIKKLRKDGFSAKFIRYAPVYQPGGLKLFMKKFFMDKVPYIGDYYKINHFRKDGKEFKQLRKKWREIRDRPDVGGLFTYKGCNFYHIIRPRMDTMFNSLSYVACDARTITSEIVKQEDYKAMIIDHERNMYGRGFILNSKNTKKKTAALSYELLLPSIHYPYISEETKRDKDSPMRVPLPDIKCVWGPSSKKVLIDYCNYPENIIKVTGNPAFDALFNKRYNRAEIKRKNGIENKGKKIVLYAAANRPEVRRFIKKLAKDNKDLYFVYKPRIHEDLGDVAEYYKGVNADNFKIVEQSTDIYELISISDYITVFDSLAGFEAMFMNKVVFVLNPDKVKKLATGLPYVDSGAATEIKTLKDFKRERKRLEKKENQKTLEKNMKKLTSAYVSYGGRGTERTVAEIEKLLK